MKIVNQYLLLCLVLLTFTVRGQEVITDWQTYHQVTRFNDWQADEDVIYVATDAGVFLLDRENYELVEHWTRTSAGLPSNRVEAVAIHPVTRTKYIGTYDIGMAFQAEDETWQTMPYPDSWAELNDVLTYCINFDAQDRLLVGTNKGLLRWEGSEWTLLNLLPEGNPLREVWSMQKLENGEVVIGGATLAQTAGDELFVYPPVTGDLGFPSFLSYRDMKVHVSTAGDVFSVTDEGEMGLLSAAGEWQQWSTLNDNTSMTFFGSKYIYEDNSGTVWVGLGLNGAARFTDGEWEHVTEGPLPVPQELDYFRQEVDGLSIGGTTSAVYVLEDETLQYETPLAANSPWSNPTGSLGAVATYWGSQIKRPILSTDQNGQIWGIQGHLFQNTLVSLATGETWTLESATLGIKDFVFDQNNDLWLFDFDNLYQVSDWEVSTTYNLPEATGNYVEVDYDGDNNIWLNNEGGIFVNVAGSFQEVSLPTDTRLVKLIAKHDSPGAFAHVYNNISEEHYMIECTTSNYADVVPPGEWNLFDLYTSHYDDVAEKLWFAKGNDQLIGRATDGTWESIFLPENWNSQDPVRRIGSYETGLWIMAEYQVAFYHNEQWYAYNTANAPIDTERLIDVALDGNQVFWMVHDEFIAMEAAQTVLSLSTNLPELTDIQPGHVFPNPASTYINMDWNDSGTAYIVDVNGRVIREVPTSNSLRTISIAELSPGSYWLFWDGKTEQRLAPFIKL